MKTATVSSLSLILLLLGGCGAKIPTLQEREATLHSLASEHNLTIQPITTTRFTLTSIVSNQCESRAMRVYIEGDGFAWVTRTRLSDDPTPINPLSAKLMMEDESGCRAYIARPCQYTKGSACTSEYWSNRRFSPEMIESYGEALDQLKKQYKLESFTLIGYSGGGAVAALAASRRSDIRELITVAGNLDTDAWINYHSIAPLEGSLNPANEVTKLEKIPQIHLIGKNDTIIPYAIFSSYASHFNDKNNVKFYLYEGVTHNSGWENVWKQFTKDHLFQ